VLFPVTAAVVVPDALFALTVRVITVEPPVVREGIRQTPKFTSSQEIAVSGARPARALTEAVTTCAACAGNAVNAVKVAAKSAAFVLIFISFILCYLYLTRL
jgi:hypothetical protein